MVFNVEREIREKFPDLGQKKLNIAQLKAGTKLLPEGYVDYVLARGRIEGEVVILDPAAQQDIKQEFPLLGYAKQKYRPA